MSDPVFYMTMAAAMLAGLGMLTTATLAGWRGWLQLRRLQLDHQPPAQNMPMVGAPSAGARIEIADLKERIRKLEAIAAGVDL